MCAVCHSALPDGRAAKRKRDAADELSKALWRFIEGRPWVHRTEPAPKDVAEARRRHGEARRAYSDANSELARIHRGLLMGTALRGARRRG